jgi:two-component system OmpR family response regulator
MPAKLLIVDDDPNIRDVIGFAVQAAGFEADVAADGATGLAKAQTGAPDLVILDIGLPEMDGFEVCKDLRKTSDVPILFLTARDDEIDRILGMEIGGDDYVTKPFSPRELVARIKAILKRSNGRAAPSEALLHGALTLDPARHHCTFAGADVALTQSEFSLLEALLAHPEKVIRRTALVDAVYGHNIHVSDRTIDSHIRNIRRKLSDAGCADSIVTVHGVGLRMGPCQPA